jgi:hypothetical protein
MKIHNVILVAVGIVTGVSLVCVWSVPSLQDFMIGNTMWNGIRNFSRDVDATQLDSLGTLTGESEKSVLITIPYLPYSTGDLEKIGVFLDGGGTLLLADDYGHGNQVLEYLGLQVRFDGKPLLDPLFCFKNQWFPKVIEFALSGELETIVLNHATALDQVPSKDVIAWSSESSYIDANENQIWDKNEVKGRLPVAAQSSIGKGTLVVVGDPSLIINTMVGQADNLEFIGYLLNSDSSGKEVLFDVSHLSQTPLDFSKSLFVHIRGIMTEPYPLATVILALVIGISIWMNRTGDAGGKQSQNG